METSRLILRQRTKEVLEGLLALPTAEQLAYLNLSDSNVLDRELQRIRKLLNHEKGRWILWDLVEKNTEAVMGNCGFHQWYPDHERAEIGYQLYDNYQKKGYMTEALEKIIAYGFSTMKLNRIEAFISPDNDASIKLIRKLNFTREGILREHYRFGDQIYDSVVYSLLRSEFDHEIS